MKKSLVLISILILFAEGFSQPRRDPWVRYYGSERSGLKDVYECSNGDLIAVGHDGQNWNTRDAFIVRTDPNGERVWEDTYDLFEEYPWKSFITVIEADNGDIITGGEARNNFIGARFSPDGDLIWAKVFRQDLEGYAKAVIETKAGEFLFGGSLGEDQGLVMTDGDGDTLWTRVFITQGIADGVQSIREVEDDGFYIAGKYGEYNTSLAKITGNGVQEWRRNYRFQDGQTASCPHLLTVGNRFYLAGSGSGRGGSGVALMLVDREGQEIWTRILPSDRARGSLSAAKTHANGVVFVGQGVVGNVPAAFSYIVNHNGDSVRYRRHDNLNMFFSVIVDRQGFPVGCGDFMFPAYICKILPVISVPIITYREPEDSEFDVLIGEERNFLVRAYDYQNDRIYYLWTQDADTISDRSQVEVSFDELGVDTVRCRVSDETGGTSAEWTVHVSELYIARFSPDTLQFQLRRGKTQEFSIDSVALVDGSAGFQWRVTDLGTLQEVDAGDDSTASVEFLRSGNYSVEGLAYRGEAQDNVVWTVRVRSTILDFLPGELYLSVLPDSLVNFEVIPFNPEADSLSFRWELDGDSVGAEAALGLRFAGDGDTSRSYRVAAMVFDGGEGDTVAWRVTVRPPSAVGEFGIGNLEFRMGEPAPNPFNATTTISYILDKPGRTRLSAFDLSGREVARLADGSREAGVHSAVWEASGVPAGVYLLRLESGGRAAVRKAVVVR